MGVWGSRKTGWGIEAGMKCSEADTDLVGRIRKSCWAGTGVCKFPFRVCFSYLVLPPAEEKEDRLVPKWEGLWYSLLEAPSPALLCWLGSWLGLGEGQPQELNQWGQELLNLVSGFHSLTYLPSKSSPNLSLEEASETPSNWVFFFSFPFFLKDPCAWSTQFKCSQLLFAEDWTGEKGFCL